MFSFFGSSSSSSSSSNANANEKQNANEQPATPVTAVNESDKKDYIDQEKQNNKTEFEHISFDINEEIDNKPINGDFENFRLPASVTKKIQDEFMEINENTNVIFVNTVAGKTRTLSFSPETTIGQIKEQLEETEQIKVTDQRLTYEGRSLDDLQNLQFYNIKPLSTLNLLLRVSGGK
jgi:hypothetical protein